MNGERNYTEFWGKDYHTVKDEYNPDWKLEGMKQTVKYALLLIDEMNQSQSPPLMNKEIPFPLEK